MSRALATAPGPAALRALTLYDVVPAGCIGFPVPDNWQAPHLTVGEIAVVDPEDREPQHGELFVIRWESGRQSVVCTRSGLYRWVPRGEVFQAEHVEPGIGWMVGDVHQPRGMAEINAALRAGTLRCSDGPYRPDHLISKLVGRIVGVIPAVAE